MSLGPVTFNSLGRDLYWSIYDAQDGRIRWIGYDDAFWWNEVSKSDAFQLFKGEVSGRIYRLNPLIDEVTIEGAT